MEVANEINISQAQVSRLEKNALKNMKNYLDHAQDNNSNISKLTEYIIVSHCCRIIYEVRDNNATV